MWHLTNMMGIFNTSQITLAHCDTSRSQAHSHNSHRTKTIHKNNEYIHEISIKKQPIKKPIKISNYAILPTGCLSFAICANSSLSCVRDFSI